MASDTSVRTVTNILVIWGLGLGFSLSADASERKRKPILPNFKVGSERHRNKQAKVLEPSSFLLMPPLKGEPSWPTVSLQVKSSMLCPAINSLSDL